MNGKSNKRSYSTTTSEFDTSASALETSVLKSDSSDAKLKRKKKKAKQKKDTNSEPKKQKTMTEFLQSNTNAQSEQKTKTNIEATLDEINNKLSNVLTKSDKTFIRDLIKETVNEMKKQILESVEKRVCILEGELHDRAIENQNIQTELVEKAKEVEILKDSAAESEKIKHRLYEQNKEIEELKDKNQRLRDKINKEINYNEGVQNDAEQYSRINNIRVYNVTDDAEKQRSQKTTELVVKQLNENLKLNLCESDIDIAHRLGAFKTGTNRPTIVKFVRREVKRSVMRNVKALKGLKMSISHDLTWLNQQVLSSIRLKDTDKEVDDVWFHEGKIFVSRTVTGKRGKSVSETYHTKQTDFAYWLNKPWPVREKKTVTNKGSPVPVAVTVTVADDGNN